MAMAWVDGKGARDVGIAQARLLWLLGAPASMARVPGEAPRAPVRLSTAIVAPRQWWVEVKLLQP